MSDRPDPPHDYEPMSAEEEIAWARWGRELRDERCPEAGWGWRDGWVPKPPPLDPSGGDHDYEEVVHFDDDVGPDDDDPEDDDPPAA